MTQHSLLRLVGLAMILHLAAPAPVGASMAHCIGWGSSCVKCTQLSCDECGGADCFVEICTTGKTYECPPGG